MNVFGIGSGVKDIHADAWGNPPAPSRTLAQAEARIAELERMVQEETMNGNALSAVAVAARDALTKVSPDHPLTQRENRKKIYETNYRLVENKELLQKNKPKKIIEKPKKTAFTAFMNIVVIGVAIVILIFGLWII